MAGRSEKLSISRTILECKVIVSWPDTAEASVLVEPYWNVKKGNHQSDLSEYIVLVEPYWNVK